MKTKKEKRDAVLIDIMDKTMQVFVDNKCNYAEVSQMLTCLFVASAKQVQHESVSAMLQYSTEFVKGVHKSVLGLLKGEV